MIAEQLQVAMSFLVRGMRYFKIICGWDEHILDEMVKLRYLFECSPIVSIVWLHFADLSRFQQKMFKFFF